MPTNNGVISKPISIYDIKTTLGHNSDDIGTLCTSPNINKWSRKKPVRYNKPIELTEDDFRLARFGLIPPNPSTEITEAAKKLYEYTKPRGITYNEWFRMFDFNGYSHNAIPPCSSTGNMIVNLTLSEKTFIGRLNFGGGDAIGMDEFIDLKELYLAFAISYRYGGIDYITYKTASSTIETRNSNVTYDLKKDLPFSLGSNISNLKYYWIGASKSKIGSDEPYEQLFYALPFENTNDSSGTITTEGGGLDLQFIASGIMTYLSASYVENIRDYQNDDNPQYFRMANDGTIYIEYTVKNNYSTEKTVDLKNSTAVARPSFAKTMQSDDPLYPTTGEVSVYWYVYENMRWTNYASITVQGGETKTIRVGVDGWMAYKNGIASLCSEGRQAQTQISIKTTNSSLPGVPINLRS